MRLRDILIAVLFALTQMTGPGACGRRSAVPILPTVKIRTIRGSTGQLCPTLGDPMPVPNR